MTEDIFRVLQKRLDKYFLGFPETEQRVEIEILKKLFTVEDAEMFLALTPMVESMESIASRVSRPIAEVTAQLEDMAQRGLLFRMKKGDSVEYGAIPFVHGLFEFQITRLDSDIAGLVEQYYNEGFDKAIANGAEAFLRVVPVQHSLDVTQNIASYDDACEILRNKKMIVVADCICRKQKGMVGKGCDKPLEACFMFGSMGQYYVDNGMGRQVDVDEAIRILTEAQESGLVTQPATAQNPGGMCNCCGDCCGILNSLKKFPKPAELVFSNHYAVIDREVCTGCEICIDRCQMDALTMNDDDLAEINLDRCIGCGLCVTTCPTEALQLVPKSEEQHRTPPVTGTEQAKFMAKKRGFRI